MLNIKNFATTTNWLRESIGLILLMLFFGLWALHAGQDACWDLRNYHFYNPYAFLHHRFCWDIAPAHRQTFHNPFFDLITYSIINFTPGPRTAEFLLGVFHGVAVFFLIKIALIIYAAEKPRLRYGYVALSVILGVMGAASLSQIGTAHDESQISIFIMVALFLVLKFITGAEIKRPYLCLIAGLILGLIVGFKLTAISYAIAFFVGLLFYKKLDFAQIKLILQTGIIFCVGYFLSDGFWMWTLYQHFHNPFFPYYSNIFHSPYAPATKFINDGVLPKTFTDVVLYPLHLARGVADPQEAVKMADPRIAVTLLLGILYLCVLGYRKFVGKLQIVNGEQQQVFAIRFVCLFFYVAYFVWLLQFSVYRFTIPLNFLAGILIIYFCMRLVKQHLLRHLLMLIVFLVTTVMTTYPIWGRTYYRDHFFEVQIPGVAPHSLVLLLGGSPVAYLIPYFPPDTRFVALDNYFVNKQTPVLRQQTIAAIQHHRGPLYVLVDSVDPGGEWPSSFQYHQNEVLKQFGLLRLDEICGPIASNMEVIPLRLCAVVKLPSNSADFKL